MSDFPVPSAFWDLPTCPQVAQQILAISPLGEESLAEFLDVIRWDPAVVARILAAANGTKFGQSWPVVSLSRARLLLDDLAIRLLSLQFTLDSLSPERNAYRENYATFWRQSRIHAVTALLLSDEDAEQSEVNPFLAGLLFALPRLALLQSQPVTAARIQEQVIQTARTWNAVDAEFHPPEPNDANRPFLLQANFPQVFVKAVTAHEAGVAESAHGTSRLPAILAVAEAMGDFLVFEQCNPAVSERWRERLNERFQDFHGAESGSAMPVDSFIDSVRQRLEEWFPANEELASETQMLCQANRELARLAWRASLAHGQAQTRAQQAEQSLKQYERKIYSLERQALRDPLTGVYNRRFFLEALQKEVARCCRYAAPIGLLFVDVDAFKPLNDRWGHLVGDQILRRVAETLQGVLRTSDILARYGGEEFVILPNDPNENGILQLAERLRQAVEQMVTKVDSARLQVTISVGCTLTVPTRDDLDLGPQLLASADAAMYDAKQLGRNKVVFRSLLDEFERELMQRTIDCTFTRWLVSRNFLSAQAVESLLSDYSPDRLPLGELAIDTGLLTDKQVIEILALQVESGERFGALAHQQELLNLSQLAMLLARQRENPIQLARLLIGKHLFEEAKALSLVKDYLASLT